MPLHPAYQASLAAAFIIIELVSGQPRIAYPVNSQLPPVAYVHQPFEFVFSPLTFSSDGSDISYALSNQPGWIHLDSYTRKLKGTPTSTDLGAPEFQLLASDNDGQTSSSVTLVVIERKALSVGDGILAQLAQAGSVSTPATLLLHPSEPFAFDVAPRVFNGVSPDTVFYAVSSDGSPLPSWIQFDHRTITFSGTSLPLPAQAYSFSIVASDVLGFSESKIDFTINTTNRLLAFTKPELSVSVSKGGSVIINSLLKQLSLNGDQVPREEIDNVSSDPPPWLHLNSSDISYSGIAPDDIQNTSFSIALSCSGTNTANATVRLQVSPESETGHIDLGMQNATAGTYFSFQLHQPNLSTVSSQVDVAFGEFSSWLSYTVANQTFHGLVPFSEAGKTQSLNLTFDDTATTFAATLVLSILKPATSSTTSSAPEPTSTNPMSTSTITSAPGEVSPKHAKRVYPAVLASVLPALAVVFLIWIVIMWARKRQRQRQERARATKFRHISSPQPGPPPSRDAQLPPSIDVADKDIRMRQATTGAPRLELPWAPSSPTRTRRRRSRKPNLSQGSVIGPSWDDLLHFERERRETLPPIPTNNDTGVEVQQTLSPFGARTARSPGKRAAQRESDGTYKDLQSSLVSNIPGTKTPLVTGLPQRMNGAGHGAGVSNALVSPDLRSSWQTTQGSIPIMMDGSRPGTILLDSFPAPPCQRSATRAGKNRRDSPQRNSKPTLRWVESESNSSDSFEVAKQYYHNQNAWNRLAGTAPLSNTAIKIISNPHAAAVMSGSSGEPSRNDGSRALVSGPSLLWPRTDAVTTTSSNDTQLRPPVRQFYSGDQRASAASSHQFDSAVSSDSQWEDEMLAADEHAAGEVYWQSTAGTPSRFGSRLPFEPSREAQHEIPGGGASAGSHRPRLADQRRQVSVEATEAGNPSRSHKGSFRFV